MKERHNRLDLNSNSMSPLEIFLGDNKEISAKDNCTWGCPTFVLDSKLQPAQGIMPVNWECFSRARFYLACSPAHLGNVSLVLNLQTLHVGLYYHIAFDDP
eukprot:11627567-Ditylum_brightwellii.AAC.1